MRFRVYCVMKDRTDFVEAYWGVYDWPPSEAVSMCRQLLPEAEESLGFLVLAGESGTWWPRADQKFFQPSLLERLAGPADLKIFPDGSFWLRKG